ncbi:Piwi domain-containing protein [Aphelenchoides fujianensis]|nr:Piwi domain-containing protein [Aphelenchoides fujianensis]
MESADENTEYSGGSDGKAGIFRVEINPGSQAYRYDVDINTAERNLVAQRGSILVGLHKSFKFINNQAFLLLDLHRAQFYASCDANGQPASLQAVALRKGTDHLEKEFQGVRMELVHEEGETFLFGSITHHPVRSYEIDGRALPDHYLTLGRKITPNAHGVHPQGRNNEVFPLELVRVFAGQQLPPHKASAELENEVTPAERLAFIEDHARKLTVGSSGELFAQFGLAIKLESNDMPILHRKPPNIAIANAFGQIVSVTPQADGKFFESLLRSRLLATKHPPQTWICAHDPEVPPVVAGLIVEELAASCQNAGLNLMPTPYFATIYAPDQLEGLFMPWSANPNDRFQLVLYVDAGRIKRLHDKLKLLETAYGIPTQKVLTKGRPNVKSDRNLVLKLGAMFGCLNYCPIFEKSIEHLDLAKHPDLLVIGYSAVQPERASPFELQRMQAAGVGGNSIDPAAVGLAANNDVVPYLFNSSFFYQNSSDDGIDREKLTAACKKIVKKKIAILGVLPTRLFVIRNSPSEDARVAAEIDAILEGWKQAAGECGAVFNELPSVTMVVANKRHRQRFFRSSGTQCANTQCGDVMAEKFVRTDTTNFFLQSHHSPRGQPKPTEYVVLRNEQQLPRVVIEQFVFTLAALHQSLASPASLPLPSHLAEQTAAQALQILKERLQSEGVRPMFAQQLQQVAAVFNVDQLNHLLAHSIDRPLGTPPAQ